MAAHEVFASPVFKYGALPFITTLVALFLKFNSRPDAKPSELEDWAIGFDLCQVAFFSVLSDGVNDAVKLISTQVKTDVEMTNLKNRVAELPWLLFLMLVTLFLVSFYVRKKGWTTPSGSPPKLNKSGLGVPLIAGILYLIGAIIWMGGQHG